MANMRINPQIRYLLLRGLRALGWGVAGGLAFLAIVCLLVVLQGQRDEVRRVQAVVVLGAAQWNGEPSPVLRARLDHGLELYQRGYAGRIILTGGGAPGDTTTEAAAGRAYLTERGVPEELVLMEDQGTSTWESMRGVAAITRANGITSVLLVSDPFHMLRSLKMAHDLGLEAYGSPTQTSPISDSQIDEAAYVLREAWAYTLYVFAVRA